MSDRAHPCPGYLLTAAVLPPPSPPLHQPVAIGSCHHRRGQKATEVLIQTRQRPCPSAARGVGKGQLCPVSTQPQHGPQLLIPSLGTASLPARGGRAQGQCVPKTCSTSGMRQQGWEKEGLSSSGSSLPQCLPDPRRALLGAKAQPEQAGETPGQNTWGGREGGQRARERRYLPHPSTPAW